MGTNTDCRVWVSIVLASTTVLVSCFSHSFLVNHFQTTTSYIFSDEKLSHIIGQKVSVEDNAFDLFLLRKASTFFIELLFTGVG